MTQILYGKHAVGEAIAASRRTVHQVYCVKGTELPLQVQFKVLSQAELTSLARTPHHQGISVSVSDFPYTDLEDWIQTIGKKATVLVCDSITDPQNLGAICRSAHCFGVNAVLLPKDRSVEITPSVVHASAGATEHMQIIRVINLSRALDTLKEAGFWTYAAEAKAELSLEKISFSERRAIVLGSEGEGIRPLVQKHCDQSFHIPMSGKFDSLNVSQAATVICYYLDFSSLQPSDHWKTARPLRLKGVSLSRAILTERKKSS